MLYKAIWFLLTTRYTGHYNTLLSLEPVSHKAKEGKSRFKEKAALCSLEDNLAKALTAGSQDCNEELQMIRQLGISDTGRKTFVQVEQFTSPGQENTYKITSKHRTLRKVLLALVLFLLLPVQVCQMTSACSRPQILGVLLCISLDKMVSNHFFH